MCFFLSYNYPRGRFHISLVYAFRSRWKTNSNFDLRLLLFVMTSIIFSFTRFILQKHVIVFSVYVSIFKNFVIYSKSLSFFFCLVFITRACTRYFYIIYRKVPASYLIDEQFLCIILCV